jgi:hypothetical protein
MLLSGHCMSTGELMEITKQQKWHLLRKTTPSSNRRGDRISKHINGLGTKINVVVCTDEAQIKKDCPDEASSNLLDCKPNSSKSESTISSLELPC